MSEERRRRPRDDVRVTQHGERARVDGGSAERMSYSDIGGA